MSLLSYLALMSTYLCTNNQRKPRQVIYTSATVMHCFQESECAVLSRNSRKYGAYTQRNIIHLLTKERAYHLYQHRFCYIKTEKQYTTYNFHVETLAELMIEQKKVWGQAVEGTQTFTLNIVTSSVSLLH